MQEGFRFTETEYIIENILNRLRNFSGIKIFTQFFDIPNSLFEQQLHWSKFQNEENQRILKEFDEISDKIIFRHSSYGVATKEMIDFLKENQVKKIFLTGIYTDVSVLKSAMDLFDNEFEVFVIKNCCNSVHRNQKNNLHESGIESLSHILGKDHII